MAVEVGVGDPLPIQAERTVPLIDDFAAAA